MKAHCTGPRRRQVLIYLGVAAITALTSGNAFSNPGHKPVGSHQNKAVKAETGKHRAVTDASLRNKAAKATNHKHRLATDGSHRPKVGKAEDHKHQSATEAKHSERAPGPRILLPRDPTSAGDLTIAPLLSPNLADVASGSAALSDRPSMPQPATPPVVSAAM